MYVRKGRFPLALSGIDALECRTGACSGAEGLVAADFWRGHPIPQRGDPMRGVSIHFDANNLDRGLTRVRDCQKLGFEHFDLKICTQAPLADALLALKQRGASVRSLHFYDSLKHTRVPGQPGYTHLGSCNDAQRTASADMLVNACQGIQNSNIQTIVLHGGDTEFSGSMRLRMELTDCLDDSGCDIRTPTERALAERARHADAHADALCRSLYDVQKRLNGVAIALLTPENPLAICFPDQMEHVITDRSDMRRSYWHSTAFAACLHKLGGPSEETWLERFGPRMAGVYLSDMLGGEGEQTPGLGEVDFKRIKAYLATGTSRVMCVADETNSSALRFGADHLSSVGIF